MSTLVPPAGKPAKYISYKASHTLEERKAESAKIRAKYPDRVPIIVERAEKTDLPDIDKHKFLAPADLTMGQFVFVIRKRVKLPADQAIFIFVNGTLPPAGATLAQIWKEQADESGFLSLTFQGESTFGGLQHSATL
jgi:GABA(A) receptor-associated protein